MTPHFSGLPIPFNPRLRLLALQVGIVVVFVILALRLWSMQIVHHEDYVKQAENNRERKIPIVAPRGNILDRYGNVLVDSRPTFSLMVNWEDIQDEAETLRILAEEFGVAPEYAQQQLRSPAARIRPVEVKSNITDADRAKVAVLDYEHPEFLVELRPQRKYPHGELACHVLGYVTEISDAQLKRPEFDYCRPGDKVGQAGLERFYNRILMGRDGYRRIIVDRRGRFVREIETVPPIPGQDIVTTLDLDLQRVAEERLKTLELNGTIAVMDPRNGEMLALASIPGYDPNLFAAGISQADYARYANNKHKPLRNRAIQDIYPPGSTWKIIMAVAAMRAGVLKPTDRLLCGGGINVGGRHVRCMGNHGTPPLSTAISKSCDGWFYRLGIKLGLDNLRTYASELGAGEYTGIDLPNEFKGYIPSLELKAATVRRTMPNATPSQYRWTEADSVYASIGQAMVRPTPLQMLRSVAGIAMRGEFHTPHFLLEARPTSEYPRVTFTDAVKRVELPDDCWDSVIEGMWGAVNAGGTAAGSALRDPETGFQMCGKTGTAQVVSKLKASKLEERDHSWFVGFGPREKPEIAAISLVEHGGFGAKVSAPNVRAVFEAWLRKKKGLPVYGELAKVPASVHPLTHPTPPR
ncbi:MAG: penicillin-binding protein 2 [Acidobacteriota bacterium]